MADTRLKSNGVCYTFDQFTDLIFNSLSAIYNTAADSSFNNIWDNINPDFDFPDVNNSGIITNKEKYAQMADSLEGMGFTVAYPRNFDEKEQRINSWPWADQFGQSIIGYRLFKKRPTREVKPRLREQFWNPDNVDDYVQIWGQLFDHQVEFEVLADTPRGSEQLADLFEDFMFEFKGYLKQNGIKELLFRDRTTMESLIERGMYGQRLTYVVTLERLREIHSDRIKKINTTLTSLDNATGEPSGTMEAVIEATPTIPPAS